MISECNTIRQDNRYGLTTPIVLAPVLDTDEEDMETERIEKEIVFMDVTEMEEIQDLL